MRIKLVEYFNLFPRQAYLGILYILSFVFINCI